MSGGKLHFICAILSNRCMRQATREEGSASRAQERRQKGGSSCPTEHEERRVYTSAQDNGTAAYYDLYAATRNGQRILFPEMAEAFNRAFPGETRDSKLVQNRNLQNDCSSSEESTILR